MKRDFGKKGTPKRSSSLAAVRAGSGDERAPFCLYGVRTAENTNAWEWEKGDARNKKPSARGQTNAHGVPLSHFHECTSTMRQRPADSHLPHKSNPLLPTSEELRARGQARPVRRVSRYRIVLPVLVLSCILACRVLLLRFSSDHDISTINELQRNATLFSKITISPLHSVKQFNKNNKHLRLDWTNVSLTSPMAKKIEAHMTNCSLPLGIFRMRNRMGLGSDLHVWSQVLCNAMHENVRVVSLLPWQWRDESTCADETVSSLNCYFHSSEVQCSSDRHVISLNQSLHMISSPYTVRCPSILPNTSTPDQLSDFRASAMEYLFRSMSPAVVHEAERQLNLVFPQHVPVDLITVQMRWGDKKKEMKLLPAHDYVKGVQQILQQRQQTNSTVSIYLATEDPKAVTAFKEAAPKEWNVYVDQYYHDMLPYRAADDVYNQGPYTARQTKGRAGLVALASLLVAMEANDFVLTTASNWSRLMNELRKHVLDARCNNCTRMVDLKYGEW